MTTPDPHRKQVIESIEHSLEHTYLSQRQCQLLERKTDGEGTFDIAQSSGMTPAEVARNLAGSICIIATDQNSQFISEGLAGKQPADIIIDNIRKSIYD